MKSLSGVRHCSLVLITVCVYLDSSPEALLQVRLYCDMLTVVRPSLRRSSLAFQIFNISSRTVSVIRPKHGGGIKET